MILFKQQVKMKIRSKQNTYHVTNENIAPSEVTDNVGDERGDVFRAIPKLSCLDMPWVLTWGALGITNLRVLSLFIPKSIKSLPKNLKTSQHKTSTENIMSSISIRK